MNAVSLTVSHASVLISVHYVLITYMLIMKEIFVWSVQLQIVIYVHQIMSAILVLQDINYNLLHIHVFYAICRDVPYVRILHIVKIVHWDIFEIKVQELVNSVLFLALHVQLTVLIIVKLVYPIFLISRIMVYVLLVLLQIVFIAKWLNQKYV